MSSRTDDMLSLLELPVLLVHVSGVSGAAHAARARHLTTCRTTPNSSSHLLQRGQRQGP